jgi:hypothetical protein
MAVAYGRVLKWGGIDLSAMFTLKRGVEIECGFGMAGGVGINL